MAGLLVDRQVRAADVEDGDDARRVEGAWFRHDRTQEDDQQHALSALVAAEGAADADVRPPHTDHGGAAGWLVLALTVVAAADPLRIRAVGDGRAQRRSLGALAGLGLSSPSSPSRCSTASTSASPPSGWPQGSSWS